MSRKEDNQRKQIAIFILGMCVVLGSYVLLRGIVEQKVLQRYDVLEDYKLVKYVEDVKVDDENLVVSGWCFYRGVDSRECQIQVFLRNVEDKRDVIWLDVNRVERDDIDAYFDSEISYSSCGFEASIKRKKLEKKNKTYEIFVKLTYKEMDEFVPTRKTVSTKRYIRDGKLTVVDPKEESYSLSASNELNEVMEKGKLLVQRSDYDICIYQYNNKLYWVAGEKYFFEEDNSTYMQYQLYTTREDKLPLQRVERGLTFDNIGFDFEKNELVGVMAPYRVAVCDIPQEYPIMYVETGYFIDAKWIWVERFNLDISSLDRK